MSDVVVDTDVVSFRFKRDTRARAYRPFLVGRMMWLSFMSLAELHAWTLLHRWGAARRDDLTRFLGQYAVYHSDNELAMLWAEVIAHAHRRGQPIDGADAWIAATSLALDAPLVTNNPDDFTAVKGLTILTI
jgi:predicted nucleic acid-binding protein